MRSADFASTRRKAFLKLFAGLIALSLGGAGMAAPSAQAWVSPTAADAASF